MEELILLGDNIKVHFAGSDNSKSHTKALQIANVKYRLYTCYPFIAKKSIDDDLYLKSDSPLIDNSRIFKHTIQDSGLFTLMFGAAKNQKLTYEDLLNWQDKLIKFTCQNRLISTCVEVDCQKVLSPEDAWKLRYRMRDKLKNRQINVFHKEDGKKGLDRLIEFADYIAISIPELRITNPKTFRDDTHRLAYYIKNKKPEIDIHLLGCTDLKMLKENNFCTSADSTSWLSPMQFGLIKGAGLVGHINNIKGDIIDKYIEKARLLIDSDEKKLLYTARCALSAHLCRMNYQQVAGNQD